MDELYGVIFQLVLFGFLPVSVFIIKKIKELLFTKNVKVNFLDSDETKNFFMWVGLKRTNHFKKLIVPMMVCFVMSLAVMLIPIFILIHFKWLDYNLFKMNSTAGKGFSVSIILVALLNAWVKNALTEEVFFRGFLGKILQRKFGFLVGLIGQGLAFGLPHGLPLILTGGSVFVGVVLIISATLVGFFQFYLNEKYANGSILPSIIVHGMMNSLSFISQL